MNWYKIANQPNTCAWIDPDGMIFFLDSLGRLDHQSWQKENDDFLQQNYGLDMYDDLLEEGWIKIRFYYDIKKIVIDLDHLLNYKLLKRVEDFVWDNAGHIKGLTIEIGDKSGSLVQFDWEDFINSGENMLDFIKGKTYSFWW